MDASAPPMQRQPMPPHAGNAMPGPADPVPAIEPPVFAAVDPGTARDLNAAIPFVALGQDRAAPFHMKPNGMDFARARDCLASAVLYEAGDDRRGQAAVAQVVLNRMRHPAFPHTVCAVVYQGAERSTGCQFTFTCDGALRRAPSTGAWQRAQDIAAAFLSGRIDPSVGMATHYHTDWVHPYWSARLDKIARVGTHLFFRWRGGWGRKVAFGSPHAGTEPVEARLAHLSSPHRADPAVEFAAYQPNDAALPPVERPVVLSVREGEHLILVDGGGNGTALAMQGLRQCTGQSYCKVVGWDSRSPDRGSPQNPVIGSVAFLYVSDKRTRVEIVLWDCTRFNRPSDSQCLSDANRRWVTFQGSLSRAS